MILLGNASILRYNNIGWEALGLDRIAITTMHVRSLNSFGVGGGGGGKMALYLCTNISYMHCVQLFGPVVQ